MARVATTTAPARALVLAALISVLSVLPIPALAAHASIAQGTSFVPPQPLHVATLVQDPPANVQPGVETLYADFSDSGEAWQGQTLSSVALDGSAVALGSTVWDRVPAGDADAWLPPTTDPFACDDPNTDADDSVQGTSAYSRCGESAALNDDATLLFLGDSRAKTPPSGSSTTRNTNGHVYVYARTGRTATSRGSDWSLATAVQSTASQDSGCGTVSWTNNDDFGNMIAYSGYPDNYLFVAPRIVPTGPDSGDCPDKTADFPSVHLFEIDHDPDAGTVAAHEQRGWISTVLDGDGAPPGLFPTQKWGGAYIQSIAASGSAVAFLSRLAGLLVFERGSTSWSFVQRITISDVSADCTICPGMTFGFDIALAANKRLLASSAKLVVGDFLAGGRSGTTGAVFVFTRDALDRDDDGAPKTSAFTYQGAVGEGVAGAAGNKMGRQVSVSPSGNVVYAATARFTSLATFAEVGGELGFTGAVLLPQAGSKAVAMGRDVLFASGDLWTGSVLATPDSPASLWLAPFTATTANLGYTMACSPDSPFVVVGSGSWCDTRPPGTCTLRDGYAKIGYLPDITRLATGARGGPATAAPGAGPLAFDSIRIRTWDQSDAVSAGVPAAAPGTSPHVGASVDVAGRVIAIGAPGARYAQVSVMSSSYMDWGSRATSSNTFATSPDFTVYLTPPGAAEWGDYVDATDSFGWSVSASSSVAHGDWVMVGAPGVSFNAGDPYYFPGLGWANWRYGAVHFYQRDASSSSFPHRASFRSADLVADPATLSYSNDLGYSVSVSGRLAVASDPTCGQLSDVCNAHEGWTQLYLFCLDGGSWRHVLFDYSHDPAPLEGDASNYDDGIARVLASDADDAAGGKPLVFASYADMDGVYVITPVGDAGSADACAAQWDLVTLLRPAANYKAPTAMGFSLSFDRGTGRLLVGAPNTVIPAQSAFGLGAGETLGRVFVFELAGSDADDASSESPQWREVTSLSRPVSNPNLAQGEDPISNTEFGIGACLFRDPASPYENGALISESGTQTWNGGDDGQGAVWLLPRTGTTHVSTPATLTKALLNAYCFTAAPPPRNGLYTVNLLAGDTDFNLAHTYSIAGPNCNVVGRVEACLTFSPSCRTSWINDDYCDSACNNAQCGWDGADCNGQNGGANGGTQHASQGGAGTAGTDAMPVVVAPDNGPAFSFDGGGGSVVGVAFRGHYDPTAVAGSGAASATGNGGVLRAQGAAASEPRSLAIRACEFSDAAAAKGGAVYLTGALDVHIDRCSFSGTAASSGGTLYVGGGVTAAVADTHIEGARADPLTGGAVYADSGQLSLSGSGAITQCSAVGGGGAIYAAAGALVSVAPGWQLSGNSATGPGGNGGAVAADGAGTRVTVSGAPLTSNAAAGDGGAVALSRGATLAATAGSSFSSNTAARSGGGIACTDAPLSGGSVALTGATLSGNTATATGGGVYLADCAATLADTTIADNAVTAASNAAGAIGGGGAAHVTTTVAAAAAGVTVSFAAATTLSRNTAPVRGAVLLLAAAVDDASCIEDPAACAADDSADGSPVSVASTVIWQQASDVSADGSGSAGGGGGGSGAGAATRYRRTLLATAAAPVPDVYWSHRRPTGVATPEGVTSVSGPAQLAMCGIATYNPPFGASSTLGCAPCEPGTTTLQPTPGFADACVAEPGRYSLVTDRSYGLVVVGASTPGATPAPTADCPSGGVCERAGTNIANMALESGFWRASATSDTVMECPEAELCAGGAIPDGGAGADALCALGSAGPYCLLCAEGWAKSSGGECLECPDNTAGEVVLYVFLFLLAAVAIYIAIRIAVALFRRVNAVLSAEEEEAEGAASAGAGGVPVKDALEGAAADVEEQVRTSRAGKHTRSVVNKLKLASAFYQVLSAYPAMFPSVTFPPRMLSFFNSWAALNVDILGVVNPGCAYTPTHYSRLMATTLVPALLGAALLTAPRWAPRLPAFKSVRKADLENAVFGWFLALTFAIYPGTSATIFATFPCQTLDTGRTYLRADYSIDCDEGDRGFWVFWAVLSMLVYTVGIPAFYMFLLHKHRDKVDPARLDPTLTPRQAAAVRDHDPSIAHLSFLFGAYVPSAAWFETYELLRKVMITGFTLFFLEGTATQVVWTCLISMAAIALLSHVRPYQSESDATLATVAMWELLLASFCTLLLKVDVTGEDGYNEDAFAAALVLSTLTVAFIAAYQLWTENVVHRWREVREEHPDVVLGSKRSLVLFLKLKGPEVEKLDKALANPCARPVFACLSSLVMTMAGVYDRLCSRRGSGGGGAGKGKGGGGAGASQKRGSVADVRGLAPYARTAGTAAAAAGSRNGRGQGGGGGGGSDSALVQVNPLQASNGAGTATGTGTGGGVHGSV